MNQYLRSLSATEQVGAMFLFIFGCLFIASVALLILSLREQNDDAAGEERRQSLVHANTLLRGQWLVESGLKDGERVIVSGIQKLKPGGAVKVLAQVPASAVAQN